MKPLVSLQSPNIYDRVDCGQNVWKVVSVGEHSNRYITIQWSPLMSVKNIGFRNCFWRRSGWQIELVGHFLLWGNFFQETWKVQTSMINFDVDKGLLIIQWFNGILDLLLPFPFYSWGNRSYPGNIIVFTFIFTCIIYMLHILKG